jgi:predicted peptidase
MTFISRSMIVNHIEFSYQIYVPSKLDSTTELPLILVLHGGGERGQDGQRKISTSVNVLKPSEDAI